jgi:hypothetical protein
MPEAPSIWNFFAISVNSLIFISLSSTRFMLHLHLMQFKIRIYTTLYKVSRPLQNALFCTISASGSNFNPRNTQCIPVAKIFAFLELEQN